MSHTVALLTCGLLLVSPAAAQSDDSKTDNHPKPQLSPGVPACPGEIKPTLGHGLALAFWLPLVLEDDCRRYGWFPAYPYRDGHKGYMIFAHTKTKTAAQRLEITTEGDVLIGRGDEVVTDQPIHTSPVAVRLAAEYSHDLETVYKPWVQLMLSTHWRFGVESGWTWLREDLGDGWDQQFIGDLNMIFRIAQHERALVRMGFGCRTIIDSGQADWGFNWAYGFDIFPIRPVVFSASIDLGNMGDFDLDKLRDSFFLHGRGQLGLVPGAVEIYGGWDVMLIGRVTIHGPMLGLRAWL